MTERGTLLLARVAELGRRPVYLELEPDELVDVLERLDELLDELDHGRPERELARTLVDAILRAGAA